ncbi:MAG: arsenate reductase (glutaredoxin) [Sulfurimonas sp.]|nr:arsenate reductase (glutaredoxin) [Sulfurimonadaceae bacterium]
MVTIWHNQRCSKSREAMSIATDLGIDSKVVKYLEADITKDDIKELLKKLGISPRELMRTKEDIYKELNLADEMDEQKLIDAMVAYPRLIERPIIIKNDKAIIGRPIDKVLPFLNS